jgi:3-oxoacyl-[acyl-carrier protein] reductase
MARVLEGKVAIITGSGRGLGKAFALRFAEEGAKLLLADLNLARVEATAREIEAKGGTAYATQADISNETAVNKMAEMVVEKFGTVDILVNNAAWVLGIGNKAWDSWTVKEWDQMFAINVRGTWLCCKAIAPLMIKHSKGKIINIGSDIIKHLPPYTILPYACSKAAIYTLTQSLARSLGPCGINVNAIAPGLTATNVSLTHPGIDKIFDSVIDVQCIKRREEPEDLAGTAVFLASKDSDFISGEVIFVNGGVAMG